uniref:Uncharacterized protein n=1 Tax=Haemonchus contortus TaxID=6289 RepID=A0A7I4YW13_HAECO
MDLFVNLSVFLLLLQVLVAIVLFQRLEAIYIRWRKRRALKPAKPWKFNEEAPRETMMKRSIEPLNISNLRGFRIDDNGQLVRCLSVLYYVADRYDEELEKARKNVGKPLRECDFAEQMNSDKVRKKLAEEMERHAHKIRRRRELEVYNARKASFKRFATDRMIGLGRNRNVVDPSTLQLK